MKIRVISKILSNKCALFTYGLTNYYECLVITVSMSRWNCLKNIVCHYIVVLCGMIIEMYRIKNSLLHLIM